MSYSHFDRLSAMDAAFLDLEDGNSHMHIGSVATFDKGPLATDEGGIDFQRILKASEISLRRNARLRQKISHVPGFRQPVWVDDPQFNIHYHIRHTALPAPGSVRLLKRLAGRIMSQQLDRGKPLWEVWYVEGLEEDRFAVISKLHHCLADGVSGTELLTAILPTQSDEDPRESGPWVPRPAPSGGRLLFEETARRVLAPLTAAQTGAKMLAHPDEALDDAERIARGLQEAISTGATPASETPFNADLGPHRRFDWIGFGLDAAKEVKNELGGKLNDVVLAVVSGAVRSFLMERGLRVDDLEFRAMVPVNVRNQDESGAMGNHLSQMLTRLPVDVSGSLERYREVVETTGALKKSDQVAGAEALVDMADFMLPGVIGMTARLAMRGRPANLVVSNVHGPSEPIHVLGARMLEVFPVVPLAPHQTLGIALFSYAGGLFWGFNADWDAIPDLHDLVDAVAKEFEALRKAAFQSAANTGPSDRA